MDAVVSGHAGVALLLADGDLASLQAGSPSEPVARHPTEIPLLLAGASDLEFLEDVDLQQVSRSLDLATAKIDALHLSLILLDPDLTAATRGEAAAELEDLLAREEISDSVERVFFSRPLPASADLGGAEVAASSATRVPAFLLTLRSLQGTISDVHRAWEAIPSRLFETAEERREASSIFVREGLFRALVLNRKAKEPLESLTLTSVLRPAVRRIARHRAILRAWLAPFEQDRQRSPAQEFSSIARRPTVQEATAQTRDSRFEPQEISGTAALAPAAASAESLDQLFRRLSPRLIRILTRYNIQAEDAEDMLQDVRITMIYRWDKIKDPESWMLGALRKRCLKHWRKQRPVDSAILDLLREPSAPATERAELISDLDNLIERLPDRCRRIFRLYRQGCELPEIAEQLGYRLYSIRKVTRRCLAALTHQMISGGFSQEDR